MIRVHEGGKVWKVGLRGAYSHVRSEKAFRALVESGIAGWEKRQPIVGAALRGKSLWDVCSYFGIISQRVLVSK